MANELPIKVVDGVTGQTSGNPGATVAQFHNTDNQALASTAYGLLTGGVAQLLNALGNIDRQRETGADSIPSIGVVTGTGQLVSPFTVTVAVSQTSGANKVITPSAMSGFNRGAPWSIQVGTVLVFEPTPLGGPVPANQEVTIVTAVTGTTFTVTLAKSHTASFSVTGFVLNQARDATIADGSGGLGIAAGATYLLNNLSNAGAGGWEGERSAAGELDGANGTGTAIAAEYEWNGNPLANANVLSGLQFDRGRNLNAKGLGAGTLANNPLAANATTLTLNAAPTTLLPGQKLLLDRAGANPETNYVGSGYTAGSTTVPLQIATQFSHALNATVEWDQHVPLGPQLNGFLPDGIAIEEEALWDPVSQKFYIERASTQDAASGQNVVMECPGLYNGSTFDRERSAPGTTGVPSANTEGTKATYSAAAVGVALTVAGDIFTITGSASKTIRVLRLSLTATATAAIDVDAQIIKRSTVDSGGTPTAWTAVPHDSGSAAATATGNSYAGATAPTAGTAVGPIRASKLFAQVATAAPVLLAWDFTTRNGQGVVLRGISQQLAVNVGAIGAGASVDVDVEWTEE